MRFHYLALAIFFLGLFISGYSFYHWEIQYNDKSQLAFGVTIGIMFIIFAYIYNWMRNKDDTLARFERQLEAQGALITGNKIEALVEEAQGVRDD